MSSRNNGRPHEDAAPAPGTRPLALHHPLDYEFYPAIVNTIISFLPRTSLISLRLVCRSLCSRADDLLARDIYFSGNPHVPLTDANDEPLPALLDLCGISSLPQPHIFNNPHIPFAPGKREQALAAHAALTRIAASVETMRVWGGMSECPLLIPFTRLMEHPVPILIIKPGLVRLGPQPTPPLQVPAHTVVFLPRPTPRPLSPPSLLRDRSNSVDVERLDPPVGCRGLRKVVYHCESLPGVNIARLLAKARDMPRLFRSRAAREPSIEFVFIFRPVTDRQIPIQRAITCDALLLAMRRDVRVTFVNAEVLPREVFPFKPADEQLKPQRGINALPALAEAEGLALRSLDAFVRAAEESSGKDISQRIEWISIGEYRWCVGEWRFGHEMGDNEPSEGRPRRKTWDRENRFW